MVLPIILQGEHSNGESIFIRIFGNLYYQAFCHRITLNIIYMNRIIFTLLLLSLFAGSVIAQQQKGDSLKVMKSERLEYQNEAKHFITDTYYGMLFEAIESTEAHSEFIALLMQEDEVKYMPEFVSDYSAQRYMDPTQYFGCLHHTFSKYNPDDLMFSVENLQIYNEFYRFGLRGCYVRAEYDLIIKYQDEILSRKRCRMYCLFPNSGTKKIIKVMQLEPIKDLMSKNDTGSDAEESFDALLKKAKGGDNDAQYKLGNKYFKGIDVHKDYETAVYWYRQAAEQGHITAIRRLFDCYYNSHGISYDFVDGRCKSLEEAEFWARKAAELEYDTAQFFLGQLCSLSIYDENKLKEAVKWYRQAAEQRHAEAQCMLGYWYENGINVPQDYQEALKWYSKAAEQGDEEAKSHLADLNSRLLKNNESKNVTESDATHEWVKVSFDTPLLFHEGTTVLQKPTEINAQLQEFYTRVLNNQQFSLSIVGHVTQAEAATGKSFLALQRAKNIESMLKKHGNMQHCEVKAVDVSNPSQSAEVKIYMYVSKDAVKNAQNNQRYEE